MPNFKEKKLRVTSVFPVSTDEELELLLFTPRIQAGFPSPADDYLAEKLDLNKFLIRNPAVTYCVRVEGDSMTGAGIYSGDILIVDRSIRPRENLIVIAILDSELTVKWLKRQKGKLYLCPDNNEFTPIEITEGADFQIWGVVVHSIHTFYQKR